MGLLAYDPDQLARLRLAMRDALTELEGTVCWSLDAQVAMVAVKEARRRLAQQWLPLVDHLLDADPLAGRALTALGFDDMRNALVHVMHHGYGWAVQPDPREDDPTIVTPEEARASARCSPRATSTCCWTTLAKWSGWRRSSNGLRSTHG